MPRNASIRVRLTQKEKNRLKEVKNQFGFSGVSDLARFLMFSNDLPKILNLRRLKNKKYMKAIME